jgi:hypothetical protein
MALAISGTFPNAIIFKNLFNVYFKREYYMKQLFLSLFVLTFGMQAKASESLTIELQGTVASVCKWSASAGARNQPIDLNTAKTDLTVAYLGHNCNAPKGWIIQASSKNAGTLKSVDGKEIPYQVKLSSGGSYVKLDAKKEILNTSFISFGEIGRNLLANIDAGQFAGTYTDTVTVQLLAK